MALSTLTATVTLLDGAGTAIQGADVIWRLGSVTKDDDSDDVDEVVVDTRPTTVRTNSSGVATWTMPVSTVVYVSIPRAGIHGARLSSPATIGGTWEIAAALSLPTPV
jgi:hypothetical protein